MRGAHRSDDPETSRDAANIDVTKLEGEVYAALRSRPCTAEEIATLLDRPLQSITPRLAPLRRKGFIYDTGTRRSGRSGRSRIVFAASVEIRPEPARSRKLSEDDLKNMIKRHTKYGITDWVVDVPALVKELESIWGIK